MTEEFKSIVSAKERHAKIKADAAKIEAEKELREQQRIAQAKVDRAKAIEQEDKMVERLALVTSEETMAHLHARILEARKPPPDPEKDRPPPVLTERQRTQVEIEQRAGQEAVERANIRNEAAAAARAKMAAEQKARDEAIAKINEAPVDAPAQAG